MISTNFSRCIYSREILYRLYCVVWGGGGDHDQYLLLWWVVVSSIVLLCSPTVRPWSIVLYYLQHTLHWFCLGCRYFLYLVLYPFFFRFELLIYKLLTFAGNTEDGRQARWYTSPSQTSVLMRVKQRKALTQEIPSLY